MIAPCQNVPDLSYIPVSGRHIPGTKVWLPGFLFSSAVLSVESRETTQEKPVGSLGHPDSEWLPPCCTGSGHEPMSLEIIPGACVCVLAGSAADGVLESH